MPRQDSEPVVTLPLIDRLIDLEPSAPADSSATRSQSVRLLKQALRRDLEWLLNTRRTVDEAPESFDRLTHSLYHYGIPDVTSIGLNSPRDRARLLHTIETAIADFEPRLGEVRVHPIEDSSHGPRVMRFQIEGLLKMDPAPEQIFFDTVLQLSTGECRVKAD